MICIVEKKKSVRSIMNIALCQYSQKYIFYIPENTLGPDSV